MKYLYTLVICATLSVLVGCGSTPVVEKPVLMQAKEKGLKNSKRIAVVNVVDVNKNRNYTSNIHSKFESFMTGITVNNAYRFTMVDRLTIENVMKEQRFSSDDIFDGSTASELGMLLGADTLMNASFSAPAVSRQKFTGSESYCKKRDGDKCKEWGSKKISCDRKTVTVEFTPKATYVASGQIIYSKSYSATQTSDRCPNQKNVSLLSDEVLISNAVSNIFNDMRRDVADYPLVLKLKLIDDDEGMSESDSSEFSMAMEFANQGMLDRACAKLNMLASSVQNSPATMYNLGVCAEINGQTDAAKGYYEKALNSMSSLSSSEKDLIFKAIKRIDGEIDLNEHNEKEKSFFDKMKDSVTNSM
ncbi:MAG: hypothetical protein ACJAYN_001292 [Bermanella sp.]|jgi:hypothetical protein